MIKDIGKYQMEDKNLRLIFDNLKNKDNDDVCKFYNYVNKWRLYVPVSITSKITVSYTHLDVYKRQVVSLYH